MNVPDYSIVDHTGQQVGTITGTTATVQMPGEQERTYDVTYRRVGPLDIDGSGWVNGADYDLYLVLFVAGNQGADYDRDGFVSGVDFDTFTQDFISGGAR